MTSAKRSRKKPKSEAATLRDALPFFKKGRGKVATSWWNVTPSGNYATDLKTGKEYARAFMPMLSFNAGASDLAVIVSAAGRAKAREAMRARMRAIVARLRERKRIYDELGTPS